MARKLIKKNTKVQKVIKKIEVVKPPKTNAGREVSTALFSGEYTEGVGRRKTAIARVRIYHSGGDFIVNDKAAGQYFQNIANSYVLYNQPLELTNTKGNFGISVKVAGSGIKAQLEALIHGLARALVKYDPQFKPTLKSAGLLTRDDRMKETRKVGMGGKARRKRQSPKR